ncbi:MAG TPA: DUF748 domain-containing protein [Candidatus Binatia bacterium]|nr:DUF748 domain-containing protein [Candidatus Binatia bacterium]
MRRRWRWVVGILGVLALLAVAAGLLVDEPLRRRIERAMNERLDGYTVSIGRLDFHPLGLSIDFEDLVVVQDASPDPPVARIPRLSASVQWRALLRRAIVADFLVDRPVLHLDLAQVRREADDGVPVERRGWQDAVRAMYPLEINQLRVRDGRITYVDRDRDRPLTLSAVQVRAENIRNIEAPDRVYPSVLYAEALVFDTGRLVIDGNADFLAEPHPGILAKIRLENLTFDAFQPIAERYRVRVRGGRLTATGDVEYGPRLKALHIEEAVVTGADIDYIYAARGTPEQHAVRQTAEVARQAANRPGLQFRVDRFQIAGGRFGFVNQVARPAYRVFLDRTDLVIENLSNHFTEGTARVRLTGRFMGTGDTTATAAFRPEVAGADFDLNVKIVDTAMVAMNDLLRAYGRFDVVAGLFSLYSELTVKEGRITGYVKPLFRNLDVYDRRQDAEKSLFRKLYERLVGGVARLLENVPRGEVATKATVEGPVRDPEANTAEVVLRLIQNAFFKAILPGFEQEVGRDRG